ncbi:LysR family transcriptional regulator [Aneurinibacillus sp. REN35]|uniref:LysR family transcriptional regulator n=1 Tax=Aneurinibacillus sp. REN35 TaxID=3237286 RepID=UPI003528457D
MKTLDKLETFIVLANCRSFTEAAKHLYCSQPTISNHIQQLEEMLTATLFYRSGKTVELTKQGEILLTYAKQITHLFAEASDKIKHAARQEHHILSVYVSNYIASYYFSDIFTQFHHLFPEQFLEMNTYCYDELKRCLLEEKTDFALMLLYPEDSYIKPHFDTSVLFEDEFPLVLPADHPWTKRKLLYCRDLQHETILLPQSLYLQQYIITQLQQRQINVRFLQMSNFEMIKKAVASYHGIAFLPYGSVADEIKAGKLAIQAVSSLQMTRKNGFAVRKNAQLTEAEAAFCTNAAHYLRSV